MDRHMHQRWTAEGMDVTLTVTVETALTDTTWAHVAMVSEAIEHLVDTLEPGTPKHPGLAEARAALRNGRRP